MQITPVSYNNFYKNNLKKENLEFKGAPKIKTLKTQALNKNFLLPVALLSMIAFSFCKRPELKLPENRIRFEVDGKDIVEKSMVQGMCLDIIDVDKPQSVFSGLAGIFDAKTNERVTNPVAINYEELKILEAIEDNDNEAGISYKDFEMAVNMLYDGKLKNDLKQKDVNISRAHFDEYTKELQLRPEYRTLNISLNDFGVENYYDKLMNVLLAEGANKKFLPRLGNHFPFVKKTLGAPMIFRDSEGNIQRIFYVSNMDYLDKESMEFYYYPNGKIRSIVACDSNDLISKKDNMPAHEYARMDFDEESFTTYAYCENHPIVVEAKGPFGLRIRKTINPGEVYKK